MMRIKILTLLLAAGWMNCPYAVQAQQADRNLLSRFSVAEIAQALIPLPQWHPFPQTAKEWRDILPGTTREQITRQAEQFAVIPFEALPASLMLEYVRTGNRSNYETVSFQKRERLFTLALAEAIEQKGRFTNAITDGVWSICEESFWGVPAHIGLQRAGAGLADVEDPIVDLFSAETATALALTDYLAGNILDSVSPLLRKRIYYEVNRRLLTPLEKDSRRYWYFGENTNNWNPWITSNWMISLLLLEKDEKRRAAELYHAMTLTDLYINSLGEDGASDEGPEYWFAAVGRLFGGLGTIESATAGRISVFKEHYIRLLASYIYKTHIAGNYFIPVADASPLVNPDGLMLYRFGKSVNDTALQKFGAYFYHKNSNIFDQEFAMADRLRNFMELENCEKEKAAAPMLKDVWLKSIELMSSRTDEGLYVASHGGHNAESHNHNDVGDIMLYVDGEPVIIDVGSGTYTAKTFSADRYSLWYNSSGFHNLPLINGFQQRAGRQYEAKNVIYRATPARTELKMDIAAAYPLEAGIKEWIRSIKVEKKLNRIVLEDSYESGVPIKHLTQTFMTVCRVDLQHPGKIIFEATGKKILMEYDAAQWDVKKEEVTTNSPDEKRLKDNWKNRAIWRLLLTGKKLSSKGKFTYTFGKIEDK